MKWAYPSRTTGQFDPYPTEWSLSGSQPLEDQKRPAQTETRIASSDKIEPALKGAAAA